MKKQQIIADRVCPKCGHNVHQVFNGKNASGSQKCLCRDCGATYTLDPKERKLSDEKVEQIFKLLVSGLSGRKIGQLLEIGPNTAYAVLKKNRSVDK